MAFSKLRCVFLRFYCINRFVKALLIKHKAFGSKKLIIDTDDFTIKRDNPVKTVIDLLCECRSFFKDTAVIF